MCISYLGIYLCWACPLAVEGASERVGKGCRNDRQHPKADIDEDL